MDFKVAMLQQSIYVYYHDPHVNIFEKSSNYFLKSI